MIYKEIEQAQLGDGIFARCWRISKMELNMNSGRLEAILQGFASLDTIIDVIRVAKTDENGKLILSANGERQIEEKKVSYPFYQGKVLAEFGYSIPLIEGEDVQVNYYRLVYDAMKGNETCILFGGADFNI